MARYPLVALPDNYLTALIGGKNGGPVAAADPKTLREHGVILCDYCLDDYLAKTNPKQLYAAGWLTNERCPLHLHYWLKFWYLQEPVGPPRNAGKTAHPRNVRKTKRTAPSAKKRRRK